MKKIYLSAITVVLLFARCGKTKTDEVPENLNCIIETPEWSTPVNLMASDSVMIDDVVDAWQWKRMPGLICTISNDRENFVKVYSWPDGKLRYRQLSIGNGPGEFITRNPGTTNKDNTIALYDIMKGKASEFEVGTDSLILKRQFNLPKDNDGHAYPVTSLLQISEDRYVLKSDMRDATHIQLYNIDTDEIESEWTNRMMKPDMSYTPYNFILTADGDNIFSAYLHIDLIEKYEIDEGKIAPVSAYGTPGDVSRFDDYDLSLIHI